MNDNEDDDFLTDRFSEFNRTLLEEQIQAHDLDKPSSNFDKQYLLRQISFTPRIAPKLVAILKQLIPAILEFSARQGLVLRDQNHQIRFLDVASYEQETQRPIPPHVPLPASQLRFNPISRVYTVTIILPEKIQTNEEVINVTRTLFAKFMGDIYFNENILQHELYRVAHRQDDETLSVSLPDQIGAIAANEFSSSTFEGYCKAYAKKQRLHYKKQYTTIKREITQGWLQQWEIQKLSEEEVALIDRIFQDFLEEYRQQPENFLAHRIEQIEKLNAQLNFMLPHQMKAYNLFEEKDQTQYIQAAYIKLEEVLAMMGYVMEMAQQIEDHLGPIILEGVMEQIMLKMQQMKKEGRVKVFLIPGITLRPQMQQEASQFPLRLIKLLPKTLPVQQWSKEVKALQKKYTNSIYQKIFEALIYLKHWAYSELERDAPSFVDSEEHKKLHQLLSNFKFREPMLQQLRLTLGVTQDYGELLKAQQKQPISSKSSIFPLQSFKRAWSYFISSLLIYLYYQELGKNPKARRPINPDKYMKVIRNYVMQQMERGTDYAMIVGLFLILNQHKGKHGLEFLLYIIHTPHLSLKYALNRIIAPLPDDLPPDQKKKRRLELLNQQKDLLLRVYEERIHNDILPGRDY